MDNAVSRASDGLLSAVRKGSGVPGGPMIAGKGFKPRAICAWGLFVCGMIGILVLQAIRIQIVYTYWGWNRSNFAQNWFWPLLVSSFLVATLAPLVGTSSVLRRLMWSFGAFIAALTLYAGSSAVILLLYGS
jgi:hypothetical protein